MIGHLPQSVIAMTSEECLNRIIVSVPGSGVSRVGIVGSRKFANRELVESFVRLCGAMYGADTHIVSGGCVGVDTWAADAAESLGLHVVEFLPKTKTREGYFARNKQIADNCDLLVAFIPKGQERSGAWNTCNWRRKAGLTYFVFDEEGQRWNRW